MEYVCKNCGNSDNIIETEDKYLFEENKFFTIEFMEQEIGVKCAECNMCESLNRFIEIVVNNDETDIS